MFQFVNFTQRHLQKHIFFLQKSQTIIVSYLRAYLLKIHVPEPSNPRLSTYFQIKQYRGRESDSK